MTDFSTDYLNAAADLIAAVSTDKMDAMAEGLAASRDAGGRLFILGVGGGAGHASHAVNDFRKLAHFEAYSPADNVSELTARTNDEGWDTTYVEWLKTSRISGKDAVLVFSVGGGSRERNVSVNLCNALDLAKERGASIYGIVGHPGGTTAELSDVVLTVDAPKALRTPLVESFQALLWHGLITHPSLAAQIGKWETLDGVAETAKSA
jgi:D-sedoheptulose 7-phosphate isomerase